MLFYIISPCAPLPPINYTISNLFWDPSQLRAAALMRSDKFPK